MNDLVSYQTKSPFAAISLTAALAIPVGWPAPVPKVVVPTHVGATYSGFQTHLTPVPLAAHDPFTAQVSEFYATLSEGQEPLGAEFEAVWDANVATLYEA